MLGKYLYRRPHEIFAPHIYYLFTWRTLLRLCFKTMIIPSSSVPCLYTELSCCCVTSCGINKIMPLTQYRRCWGDAGAAQWEPRWTTPAPAPPHTWGHRLQGTHHTSHLPPTSHITLLWHGGLRTINYILYSKSALWKSSNDKEKTPSLFFEDIM